MFWLLLVCIAAGAVGTSALESFQYDIRQAGELFEDFILTYSKAYSSQEEKQKRYVIFMETLKRINDENSVNAGVFAVNSYSDLTQEEKKQYMGFVPSVAGSDECGILTDKDITTTDAPQSLDWTLKGAVTPIKSQGACGSCWAFSCVANIEGQYFIKNQKLKSFSEQEFLDCSPSTLGCDGGNMAKALIDIQKRGGVELESTYPYTAEKGECKFNISKAVTKIVACKRYLLEDEETLKQLLVKRGPLIIGVNGNTLHDYRKGIMNKKGCESTFYGGHAVLLAGYGTDDGIDYWLIKNSWGSSFGERGYFRITRGDNTCRVLSFVASAEL